MDKRLILDVLIVPSDDYLGGKATVIVTVNKQFVSPLDGSLRIDETGEREDITLFTYFDDELSFREEEFKGLTVEQGRALFTKKDIAYLQA